MKLALKKCKIKVIIMNEKFIQQIINLQRKFGMLNSGHRTKFINHCKVTFSGEKDRQIQIHNVIAAANYSMKVIFYTLTQTQVLQRIKYILTCIVCNLDFFLQIVKKKEKEKKNH